MVVLFSIVWAPFRLFSQWRRPVTSPQHLLYLFGDGHSDSCEVMVHRSLICLPEHYWCWASFHVSVDHLCVLFGEIQIVCLFLKFCFYFIFLLLSCVSSLYNTGSDYLPYRWYFFPLCTLSFLACPLTQMLILRHQGPPPHLRRLLPQGLCHQTQPRRGSEFQHLSFGSRGP